MCVNPRRLNNGAEVACRECWQCRSNWINDWVGRCIAESQTARACHSVTLTYGPDSSGRVDHERAALLTYSDVQKYMKRLRRNGFPLKFFAVGEFGSAKGRAHWHAILFWQDAVPEHQLGQRFNERHWPHGFSHWDKVNAHSVRYVCKYINKDARDTERQRNVAMSKFPPIGSDYFAALARRYVDQGLAPRDPSYSFPGVVDAKGKTIQFRLKGNSLDRFCEEYLREWEKRRGGHPPASTLISDYADRKALPTHTVAPGHFRPMRMKPWIDPPGGGPMYFSEVHNAFACDADGVTLFWSYDLQGKHSWQSVIRTETQAELLREAYERRKALGSYRDLSRGT